jgi:hypothetical protein
MPDQKPSEQSPEDFSKSLEQLKQESQEVKAKIEQEKRRHDLPLDSNLGDPAWEEKAADRRFDVPDDEDN